MSLSLPMQPAQTSARINSVIALLVAITCVKLLAAGLIPLSGDEALYWLYSKHLSAGFVDHPGMNPLMIRVGATLFGDTPFGVRFVAVLTGLPATWAVWRAATLLTKSDAVGATAALLFNVTAVMTIGSIAATSDPYVVTAAAFILYFLARLDASGNGCWWLAIGAAFGLGMCSKYTTAFFAISILAWVIIVPKNRHWLSSAWAWTGAALALAIFAPVILWNAGHEWASFGYQSGRLTINTLSITYPLELIGSQLVLATPPIFILGCIGLGRGWRRSENLSAHVLLAALVAPMAAYFLWHSLHERVQGNWPEPIYPAFVVAAAWACHELPGVIGPITRAIALWSRRLAVPFGLTICLVALAQGAFGLLPLGSKDPTARRLAVGWDEVAPKIDAIRARANVTAIVTTDYTLTGWLSFYLPTATPVVQMTERIRWVDAPQPDAATLSGPLLYVCRGGCPHLDDVHRAFGSVAFVDSVLRERNGAVIDTYKLYRLGQPTRPVLSPVYPAMSLGGRDD